MKAYFVLTEWFLKFTDSMQCCFWIKYCQTIEDVHDLRPLCSQRWQWTMCAAATCKHRYMDSLSASAMSTESLHGLQSIWWLKIYLNRSSCQSVVENVSWWRESLTLEVEAPQSKLRRNCSVSRTSVPSDTTTYWEPSDKWLESLEPVNNWQECWSSVSSCR